MLFVDHEEAFKKMVQFLFMSVGLQKGTPEQVIALQSIDSLITVVSDSDLAPRMEPLLRHVVQTICDITGVVQYSNYFEFVVEFVKFYAVALLGDVLLILNSVISRILSEHNQKN